MKHRGVTVLEWLCVVVVGVCWVGGGGGGGGEHATRQPYSGMAG